MIRLARSPITVRPFRAVSIQSRCLANTARIFQSRVPKNNSSSLGIDRSVESNIQSETNKLAKTGARFWTKGHVHFNPETKRYEVQLDGKTLRTPLGFPLELPESKKQLAYLIAHEWTHLPDLKVKSSSLPLTALAARAIDLSKQHLSEDEKAKEMLALEDIKLQMLRYLDTDTCLIFATNRECDGKLRKRQEEIYRPLIAEFNDFFTKYAHSKKLIPENESIELKYLDCETDGLRGNKQGEKTQEVVMDWLDQLPIYDLVALEKTILTAKSFLCGVALLRSNVNDEKTLQKVYQLNKQTAEDYYHRSLEDLVELADLETIFQTGEWGEVEDTHDVDKHDWLRNLASAALVCH
ncbi:Protein ATP12, mitochondrial [Candida viswanathii]|uniref:Protein ATP12, mitochondrial n=1 Tax=Candida viswanathii TaxID=5486 RepID=A0A367Y4Z0_9ASCO|nr:Protein ATP12, mitochondrial [Candida viswanathii]